MAVFVIGAGQMGAGIAQVAAQAGIETYLNDISEAYILKGIEKIRTLLEKNVAKGKISAGEKDRILSGIKPALSLDDAKDCDLVIEAVIEKIELKQEIFSRLDKICKSETILASNTSSLPITEIAAATARPEKVIGMHFMQPVPVMSLVEVIRGLATSDETFGSVEELSKKMGKVPVEVKDVPGFISNRVLQMMINEAIYCVYEGVASPEGIDEIMKRGMNHPMGPLQLADFIGLDTVLYIMETMYKGYCDSKYRPCPLLRQYVKAGWLGRKSGRGFYTYQ
ncbi:MAG: 3-hydroxybutyryl-CoA dehydrogenase [Fusobacteriaceae bacterium]|jgi:3-hydroxybutyryl-CoA dehydrogenase|nr:3-hydroxybutyryl-CoA dehydrogenase [Fusobacteriaceae bacterium]